jgi:hypothetical protein
MASLEPVRHNDKVELGGWCARTQQPLQITEIALRDINTSACNDVIDKVPRLWEHKIGVSHVIENEERQTRLGHCSGNNGASNIVTPVDGITSLEDTTRIRQCYNQPHNSKARNAYDWVAGHFCR